MKFYSNKTNKLLKIINENKKDCNMLFKYLKLTKCDKYYCYIETLCDYDGDFNFEYYSFDQTYDVIFDMAAFKYETISLNMKHLLKIIKIDYIYVTISSHHRSYDKSAAFFEQLLKYNKCIYELEYGTQGSANIYSCYDEINNLSCLEKFVKSGKIKNIIKTELGYSECNCRCKCNSKGLKYLKVVEEIYLKNNVLVKTVDTDSHYEKNCCGCYLDNDEIKKTENESKIKNKSDEYNLCNCYKCFMNMLKYDNYEIL